MKKLFNIILFALLLISSNVIAQNLLISVQSGTQTTFYTDLQKALDSADAGSTIVLPVFGSGDYRIKGNFTINKKLFIYGVGHYPDSTKSTGRTIIEGNIYICTGADGGCLSGLCINGEVRFGTSADNQTVNDYSISRSYMINLYLGWQVPTKSKNLMFSENVIINRTDGVGINGDCTFQKNIICGRDLPARYPEDACGYLNNFNYTAFHNNIFLREAYDSGQVWGIWSITSCSYCFFENNIFVNKDSSYGLAYFLWSDNNTFNNNIFEAGNPVPYKNNTGTDNIGNQSHEDIFKNQAGHSFDYSHDYDLKDDSPGKGAGTDGYDIGIYGSDTPYKEGAVPVIPHFLSKKISPTEVTNGKLNINVKIQAQTK